MDKVFPVHLEGSRPIWKFMIGGQISHQEFTDGAAAARQFEIELRAAILRTHLLAEGVIMASPTIQAQAQIIRARRRGMDALEFAISAQAAYYGRSVEPEAQADPDIW